MLSPSNLRGPSDLGTPSPIKIGQSSPPKKEIDLNKVRSHDTQLTKIVSLKKLSRDNSDTFTIPINSGSRMRSLS